MNMPASYVHPDVGISFERTCLLFFFLRSPKAKNHLAFRYAYQCWSAIQSFQTS